MFSSARDVAEGVLRLLEKLPIDERLSCEIELAAGVLAVHVHDWYVIKDLGQPEVKKTDKAEFARKYPDWDVLRQIANGFKHPELREADVSLAKAAFAEWEHIDYWNAPQQRKTLFVEVDGIERSVHSLAFGFCRRFLAAEFPRPRPESST